MSEIERSRSHLALDPRSRHLSVSPAEGYVVGDNESLAEALHRLTTDQFTIAIDALSDPRADITIATSATLQSIARIMAVLRLVRSSIGEESFRAEHEILRDTDALLRGLLVGQAELRALDQLRARYHSVLRPEAFGELRSQLHHHHQLRRLQALSEGESLQRALHRLRRARARFAAWPIDHRTDAALSGREPVSDAFESVAAGLFGTYRRGRKQWRKATADAAAGSTRWRRECSDLGHQLEVLSSSWPAVLAANAAACHQLSVVLGEDHALGALSAAAAGSELTITDVERSLLGALIESNRRELAGVASVIGARIYLEEPDQFVARLSAYWTTHRAAFHTTVTPS